MHKSADIVIISMARCKMQHDYLMARLEVPACRISIARYLDRNRSMRTTFGFIAIVAMIIVLMMGNASGCIGGGGGVGGGGGGGGGQSCQTCYCDCFSLSCDCGPRPCTDFNGFCDRCLYHTGCRSTLPKASPKTSYECVMKGENKGECRIKAWTDELIQ